MSRNIPRVRRWRVTYRDGSGYTLTIPVDTINKRFARWLTRNEAVRVLGAARFIQSTATVSRG